ncbi:hypothetical protein [Cedecea sp.]|uniref:hypothetical protein n=1 Tax=Cedecea sp. TaxID=1970739 RepID=UPI001381F058|nr:hypothetical protein [Enterobacteriaceae bacterium RIT693]
MNRTILKTVKSPGVLLFAAGFAVAVLGFAMKEFFFYPVKAVCVAPVSYYSIDEDENWTLTRGVYRFYREGLTHGRTVYIGTISHFVGDLPKQSPIPVLREVRFTGILEKNIMRTTVASQSRRLGDQSTDAEVVKYVFPHITPGETSTSSLYLLNGKVIASGTETVPRILCIN